MKLIDKEKLINRIRRMMDIDGFRDGDAVSRRTVIGVIDNEPEIDTDIYEDDRK